MPEPAQPRTVAAHSNESPRAGGKTPRSAAAFSSVSPRAAAESATTAARAITARIDGSRSRGRASPEDRTRASRNALKRGLTALRRAMMWGEDMTAGWPDAHLAGAFAPRDALEARPVHRRAEADWRLHRASGNEIEIVDAYQLELDDGANILGLATIRDGHRAGPFTSLMRYGNPAEREYHRLLGRLLERTERRDTREIAKRTKQHIDSERLCESSNTVSAPIPELVS